MPLHLNPIQCDILPYLTFRSTAKADQLKELADRERRMAEAEAEATKRQHELELKDQLLMEEREDLEELLSELQLKRASLTEQEVQPECPSHDMAGHL